MAADNAITLPVANRLATGKVIVADDGEHSFGEERFIIVGSSATANVLTVCHRHRSTSELIRIISARRAAASEEADYWRLRHET